MVSEHSSRFALILLSIVLGSLSACTPRKSESLKLNSKDGSIINGRPVALKDGLWKHTVSVGPAEEPFCTGVIVASDTILTAGHCADGLENTYVHFGLDFASKNSIRIKIKSVTPHPDYCSECGMPGDRVGEYADLSIVKIGGTVPAGFEPVEILAKSDLSAGQQVVLAGFGLNEKQKYESIMKVTTVPLQTVGNSELITDETKSGSCSGDSGGPAYVEKNGKFYLAGITSRGDTACRPRGIYTIPDYYNDWILDLATAP